MTSALFSPLKIKEITLKNRIVMAPMCMYSAGDDGLVTEWHRIHYATRAIGGTGLILLEATAVERRGRISASDLGIWEDRQMVGLKQLVDLVHDQGSMIGIQLGHAGRKGEAPGEAIVAPSPLPFSEKHSTPDALSTEDIRQVIQSFREGARRADEAGFDLIQLHGAHGYLINQFLSPLTNHRQDEYGGSPENRVRFLREILIAVKKVIPSTMPVMLRISAEEYAPEGNHPDDLARLLNMVSGEGLDMVDVSSGAVVNVPLDPYPGYQLRFAETIREKTGLPVVAGGLVTKPDMAEEILRNQRADLVFLGRELLRNPFWPLNAAQDLGADLAWPTPYQRAKPSVGKK